MIKSTVKKPLLYTIPTTTVKYIESNIKPINADSRPGYMWAMGGKRIYFNNPQPDDFDINTIAIGLSRECRFGNQTTQFYSVAQHSILVSQQCPKHLKMHGLLHDASEAYLKDLIKPLKRLPDLDRAYSPVESLFMTAIAKKFDFAYTNETKREIKEIERAVELTEIRDLMQLPEDEVIEDIHKALPQCLNREEILPVKAAQMFLDYYWNLLIPY